MGPSQVYDPTENIVYVNHPEPARLESILDIEDYFEKVLTFWRVNVRRKAYYLIDWTGFELNIRQSEVYGECVKDVRSKCAITIVRFGKNPLQRAVTRAVCVRHHAPSHVYSTKEEALTVIKGLKAGSITLAST